MALRPQLTLGLPFREYALYTATITDSSLKLPYHDTSFFQVIQDINEKFNVR